MSTDIMIDLETLGTTADAVIVSIGAVQFDMQAGQEAFLSQNLDKFYVAIKIDSQSGRHVSGSTLKWWMGQSEQARAVFSEQSISIETALIDLGDFIRSGAGSAHVWSNGADFDLPMLAHAYEMYGVPLPWKPYAGRCYRTYKNLPGARAVTVPRMGEHHNALDDAIYQANHLCAIHQALFGKQEGGAA